MRLIRPFLPKAVFRHRNTNRVFLARRGGDRRISGVSPEISAGNRRVSGVWPETSAGNRRVSDLRQKQNLETSKGMFLRHISRVVETVLKP